MQYENSAHSDISVARPPIERRRVSFSLEDIDKTYFYRDNPQISAFFVGLSVCFPPSEAEFIKSVKLFEDQITDAALLSEVKSFIHQEAHHALQHRVLNDKFAQLGYNTAMVEKIMQEKLQKREKHWTPARRLARTVAAEHVTATWANWCLKAEEKMSHMPTSLRHLLQWHAIEEIEHKSVAFDLYRHCVDNRFLLNMEFRRFLYFEFPYAQFHISRGLLKNLGYKATTKDRKILRDFLFSNEGIVSSLMSHFRTFTDRGFHPWGTDDSVLVETWRNELSPYFT